MVRTVEFTSSSADMRETTFQLYRLSELGRSMTWQEYKVYGYGLTQWQDYGLRREFGPITHWRSNLTLGEIEDTCPFAGRTIAKIFAETLNLPHLAVADGPLRRYSEFAKQPLAIDKLLIDF
jgi:hypothetical protein